MSQRLKSESYNQSCCRCDSGNLCAQTQEILQIIGILHLDDSVYLIYLLISVLIYWSLTEQNTLRI